MHFGIKHFFRGPKVRLTLSALEGGAALGFDADAIIGVVMALTVKDFIKA
jgi:motility quorum-sensing regulator/GCU-specific mRNA interferase toxin